MKLARRLEHIEPFYVMECAKAADAIARSPACDPAQGGEPMIFLNIGEPDFTAVPAVQRAAAAIIEARPPLISRPVTLRGNLRLIAHSWYGDHARAVEVARLNPGLRKPNLLMSGEVLNAYAQ